MAFHPFRIFRKHQKTLLAAVMILCMITFVFCSGAMGTRELFADLIGGIFGSRQQAITTPQGKPLTMYGKKVTLEQLIELREQFAILEVERQAAGLRQSLEQARVDVKRPGKQQDLNPLTRNLLSSYGCDDETLRKEAEKENLKELGESQLEARARQKIHFIVEKLREIGPEQELKKVRLDQLLDFLLWRHQADRLGIQLNQDAVYRYRGPIDLRSRNARGRAHIYSADRLYAVYRDQARGEMAKALLLGSPGRAVNPTPDAFSTYDLWEFYRENFTTLDVALLPILVDSFLGETKSEDEKALLAFFNQYKNIEKQPDSPQPGFKRPQQVQIEWIAAGHDAPYYQKAGREMLLSLLFPKPGNPWSAAVLVNKLKDLYETNKASRFPLLPWTHRNFVYSFYWPAMNRPENVTSTVGMAIGTGACRGPATLAALVSYQGGGVAITGNTMASFIAREIKSRAGVSGTLLLSAYPSPLTAAALFHHAEKQQQFLPPEVVRNELIDMLCAEFAREFAVRDLLTLYKDLQSGKDKPAAVVAKFLKDRDMDKPEYHGITAKGRTAYDIADDPALKPFKTAYEQFLSFGTGWDASAKKAFAELFFNAVPEYVPKHWPSSKTPQGEDRDPESDEVWRKDHRPFLYWKTENKPAYVPRFEEVKQKVDQEARLLQARELAEKKAKELSAKAQATGGSREQVRALAEELKIKPIWLDAVTSRVDLRRQPIGPGFYYKQYRIPSDKLPIFASQPTLGEAEGQFIKQLLSLQKAGDTTILSDPSERIYYLAILLKPGRNQPTLEAFYEAITGGMTALGMREKLVSEFERQRALAYQETLHNQLRHHSGAANEKGVYLVSDKSRKDFRDSPADNSGD